MDANHFPKILGTATLNEKGQLVIPAEARNELELEAGTKIVIMKSPRKSALILIKAEHVEGMLKNLSDALNDIKSDTKKKK